MVWVSIHTEETSLVQEQRSYKHTTAKRTGESNSLVCICWLRQHQTAVRTDRDRGQWSQVDSLMSRISTIFLNVRSKLTAVILTLFKPSTRSCRLTCWHLPSFDGCNRTAVTPAVTGTGHYCRWTGPSGQSCGGTCCGSSRSSSINSAKLKENKPASRR